MPKKPTPAPEPEPEPKVDPIRMLGLAISGVEDMQRNSSRFPSERIHQAPPTVSLPLEQARELYEICRHARNIGAAVQHLEKS